MRTTLLPVRSRRVRLLYGGVLVFVALAAFTAVSVWRAWNERAGQVRAAAVFELVQQRMPSRPTEAPGAMAWLRERLAAYGQTLPESDAARYARLWAPAESAPPELVPALAAMRDVALRTRVRSAPAPEGLVAPLGNGGAGAPALQPFRASVGALARATERATVPDAEGRRTVSVVGAGDGMLVVTRRRALEADSGSNRFVERVAAALTVARPAIDRALRAGGRPVRLYTVAEDGTLVSLPWAASGEAPESVARGEALLLAARPTLPSFAPEEFFFTFEALSRDAVRYSGFYLDLGGRGLVSTLTIPLGQEPHDGVLALDVAHDIDWDRCASTIGPPLAAAMVRVPASHPRTWSTLRASLGSTAPEALHTVLARVAESQLLPEEAASPITHAVVEDAGAVAAFHVSETAWLLAFFPRSAPSFPTAAVALLGVMLTVLLAGFEINRRKAEREAEKAARALGEKQNLLNTMQVPLMVVDPNTDVIVSANRIAESIGIRRGARFIDRVSNDPRARALYARTQVTTGARRAYGVPIRIEAPSGEASEQFALVRSVAVTAPIEALEADERHRLGILFLVEPKSDLALLLEDVEATAHRDERRRLAGLLSHGLDALVQVLQRSLAGSEASAGSPGLNAWLAEYLERRIHVTAWLLDNWDRDPPPHDAVVDAAQAAETLVSLERVFAEARRHGELRARLGWANGPLSTAGEYPTVSASVDWPSEFELTMPIRGGLGFFLTEALSNAMRHGAAGSVPSVVLRCNRVRSELECAIGNERRDDRSPSRSTYGGLAILEGMARLFGWRDFNAAPAGSRFVVSWRAQVTRRDLPGKPD